MRNPRLILCIYPPIWPFQLFTPLNIGQRLANCAMIGNKPTSGVLTQHPFPSLTLPPAIIIQGIDDLRAALEAASSLNRALTVLSIPGAAGSAGAPWFHALIQAGSAEFPNVPLTGVLDCADQPGFALAALRTGCRDLLLLDSSPGMAARPRHRGSFRSPALRFPRPHIQPALLPRPHRGMPRVARGKPIEPMGITDAALQMEPQKAMESRISD